ncbi:MAG TPA: hypothetical protein VGO68_21950 [Pyrinomonadaceae bacterium]|jgi:hypothetical protein|nr:hypothetical protein [Pyrinomonadaceae bacterium]
MPTRKPTKHRSEQEASAATKQRSRNVLTRLFAKANRGLLLDVVVFILNIFLMRFLTRQFLELFSQVDAENPSAKLGIGLIFASMWILPAAGAILKRWSFHQRRDAPTLDTIETKLGGCLFNPLFYFCLNLVISAAVMASLGDFFLGRRAMETGAIFVPFIFAILILTILQTFFIYRYFSQPKQPPKWNFLRTRQAETLGDICLFLNMILFQVFWNMLTFAGLGHPSGVIEFLGRLFFLCFIALLIYFPPRMFYLAEDINKRRTWLTMLLANSPVIVRVLIGSGSNSPGW